MPVKIYPTAVGEPQNALPLPLLQQYFILKMIPIPQKSRGGIPLLQGNPAELYRSRSHATLYGKLFHAFGPATVDAVSPNFVLVLLTAGSP